MASATEPLIALVVHSNYAGNVTEYVIFQFSASLKNLFEFFKKIPLIIEQFRDSHELHANITRWRYVSNSKTISFKIIFRNLR